MSPLPKRLIEVDLPIKRISTHARQEKSIRQGHISTLHIWWARRPLAACRAVICASLWPDPADPDCPEAFRQAARAEMSRWTKHNLRLFSKESLERFINFQKNPQTLDDNKELRSALLDFIADFANWDNSTVEEFVNTSRTLTQSAHEALGGAPGTRPMVVDSFAGGGSIPLEALRVGADAFASDLNPVPVLLNKVILEYIPKYGRRLAEEVRKWGEWVERQAQRELAEFYPHDADAQPIAYLWARTVQCEGPGCGAEVPLMRSFWLAKKGSRSVGLRLVTDKKKKQIDFEIVQNAQGAEFGKGTVRRSGATCPICGYTTAGENVRKQFVNRRGGANDARLIAVVLVSSEKQGRIFRLSNADDVRAFRAAALKLRNVGSEYAGTLSLIPDEILPYLRSIFNIQLLGVNHWADLFNARQLLALTTFVKYIKAVGSKIDNADEAELRTATVTCLALTLSKLTDLANSLCAWEPNVVTVQHLFGRQAMGIIWDFAEGNPIGNSRGSWNVYFRNTVRILSDYSALWHAGQVERLSATDLSLPDDSVQLFLTDPPYYDAVPYADLSDFFYVWLKRMLGETHADLFSTELTPKEQEIVQLAERNPIYAYKTKDNFEKLMRVAMSEGRRVLEPRGIGVVVFAHKSTAGWETQLQAMLSAGWIIVASWPIDTELATRLRGMESAVLASSVHLVLRPRENPDGSVRTEGIGDWRDVLQELPQRIHDWMPRLAEEGVVGADAIFACLGPALEIFSRYSSVEKASGQTVTLKEYLEHVWAAIAKEALATVFKGADASGFEEDARVTAIWLWTLFAGAGGDDGSELDETETAEEESETTAKAPKGYVLEYDAARKIAQGLGANLESLTSLVEIKGEVARLLPVAERTRRLFGKDGGETSASVRKKKSSQLKLGFVAELEEAEEAGSWGSKGAPSLGATVLDRVHQCMILFAAGRSEALRGFLVNEGVGRDERFWRLAQVLSFMYPKMSDEKRWIDGVLARKKGLGF
jgi:putative DNA methylase